jgi:hypothetical protein
VDSLNNLWDDLIIQSFMHQNSIKKQIQAQNSRETKKMILMTQCYTVWPNDTYLDMKLQGYFTKLPTRYYVWQD